MESYRIYKQTIMMLILLALMIGVLLIPFILKYDSLKRGKRINYHNLLGISREGSGQSFYFDWNVAAMEEKRRDI